MKKLLTLASLAVIAAVAVPLSGAAASGGTGEMLKPFCTTGTFRCMSALRVDLPVVPHATASHDGMGPADLRAAYRLASAAVTNGTGQTVALVDAYDDPTIESDLATYRAYYGLPPCTTANGCFKKVNQDGEQGNYPIVANPSWEPEIALDTEMVSAICPNCHILLVEANSADETVATSNPVQHSDLGAAVDTAVNLGATEVSNSYGIAGPEPDQTFFDHYYDHPGVAITASAGDQDYGTIWPAASPFVTAVGGTELTADPTTARGWSESVWGSLVPGRLAERGTGHRQRLLALGAEAGVAARRRLLRPHRRRRVGGRGQRRDLRLVAGDRRLGRRRRHEHRSPLIASVYALAGNAKSTVYGSYPYSHQSSFHDVTRARTSRRHGVRLPLHR